MLGLNIPPPPPFVIKKLYAVLQPLLFHGYQMQVHRSRTKRHSRQQAGAGLLFKEFHSHFEVGVSLNLLLRNKLHLKAIAFQDTPLNFEITVIMQPKSVNAPVWEEAQQQLLMRT